ncbi:MAG: DUF2188 domain-containing protein [Mycoplasmataceae bacterium]|nr:DUF2188 domain-containing protein [Mycoplasmataceae bacterium]
MTRYVIRKNEKWAVVNANYKKSIKIFDTQKEAINFSKELLDTKFVVIQGKDNKFRKVEGVSSTEGKRTRAPIYVYKNMDKDIYKSKFIEMIMISTSIAFLIIAIIFATLYTLEVS